MARRSAFQKGEVAFENELMSPGKALVTWYSQQNYQTNRNLAKLPFGSGADLSAKIGGKR